MKKLLKRIDGLEIEIHESVYDPAEDSFLLAEGASIRNGCKILEIGSGTGYVSIFLSRKYPSCEFFCTDINFQAAKTTKKNALKNKQQLEIINGDMFDCFKSINQNTFFDVVLFNSPYLPVKEKGSLESSWSGGEGGMEIITRFLTELPLVLKQEGSCYLVISSKTNTKTLDELLTKLKMSSTLVDQVKEGNERILLYEIRFIL